MYVRKQSVSSMLTATEIIRDPARMNGRLLPNFEVHLSLQIPTQGWTCMEKQSETNLQLTGLKPTRTMYKFVRTKLSILHKKCVAMKKSELLDKDLDINHKDEVARGKHELMNS